MKKEIFSMIFPMVLAMSLCLSNSGLAQQDQTKLVDVLRAEYGETSEFPRKFIYDKVDLNNDGVQEYLVGLIGPDFCGTGGCSMLFFGADFRKIAEFTLVQFPIYLGSDEKEDFTKGYKNIYLRTGKIGYVKLVWNGKGYPKNPSTQPAYSESSAKKKAVFLDAESAPAFEF